MSTLLGSRDAHDPRGTVSALVMPVWAPFSVVEEGKEVSGRGWYEPSNGPRDRRGHLTPERGLHHVPAGLGIRCTGLGAYPTPPVAIRGRWAGWGVEVAASEALEFPPVRPVFGAGGNFRGAC